MRWSGLGLGITLVASIKVWGGPPAYTYNPAAAGTRFGMEAGQQARQDYLDHPNRGSYCNARFTTLVRDEAAKIAITPPQNDEWKSGAKYGDYLQSYFASVCSAYASEMSFRGAGEPCGSWRKFSDDYAAGIKAGQAALAGRFGKKSTRLSYGYCEGTSSSTAAATAEAARKDFLNALSTEVVGLGGRTGAEHKEYVRGFVLGLCTEFASDSCEKHLAAKTVAEFYDLADPANREVAVDESIRGPRPKAGEPRAATPSVKAAAPVGVTTK